MLSEIIYLSHYYFVATMLQNIDLITQKIISKVIIFIKISFLMTVFSTDEHRLSNLFQVILIYIRFIFFRKMYRFCVQTLFATSQSYR